jgi:hypothetical protein
VVLKTTRKMRDDLYIHWSSSLYNYNTSKIRLLSKGQGLNTCMHAVGIVFVSVGLLLSAESCRSRERLATVEPRYKDTQHKDILNIRIILKILDPNLDFLV